MLRLVLTQLLFVLAPPQQHFQQPVPQLTVGQPEQLQVQ